MRLFRSRAMPWPPKPLPKTPVLNGPPLSVIVICYEMASQINNTLHTLLPPYQEQVQTHQYEVAVIDNGSTRPLSALVWNQADNVRYLHVPKEKASVNPGVAVNWAVAGSRSPMICIMIDGARVLTPGVLRWGIDLATLSQDTLVDVRGWDLSEPIDELDLSENPYNFFARATPSSSAPAGFLKSAYQSTCLFMSRVLFDRIGGFDERYKEPGGGLCNTDFFHRAVRASNQVFTLLGEGSFHQYVNTPAAVNSQQLIHRQRREYEHFSRRWKSVPVEYQSVLAGHVPAECRRWLLG